MTADGYVVSQGAKNSPLCALPRVCYSPALLQQAYDFPTGKKAPTGAGQTIVIVVPYGSPTIEADLATFDSTFNIAPPRSFSIVTGTGAGGVGSGDLVTWGVETSASVEWAHAMAPGANIVLAVSPTDDIADIVATEAQLLPQYPGAIVSQSFGDDETDPSAQDAFQALHDVFAAATALGGTILASAGDFGATDCPDPAYGCGGKPVASYPASDPLVTGVGGTEGNPYPGGLLRPHGEYGGEQVWNEGDTFGAATGGAPSVLFDSPSYQQGITGNTARTVPDVSYNAAINGGIQVYYGLFGSFITFGGTSAGPPQWAAIIALANEARAASDRARSGSANTALYAIAQDRKSYREDFHDITVGTNALGPFPGSRSRASTPAPATTSRPVSARPTSSASFATWSGCRRTSIRRTTGPIGRSRRRGDHGGQRRPRRAPTEVAQPCSSQRALGRGQAIGQSAAWRCSSAR